MNKDVFLGVIIHIGEASPPLMKAYAGSAVFDQVRSGKNPYCPYLTLQDPLAGEISPSRQQVLKVEMVRLLCGPRLEPDDFLNVFYADLGGIACGYGVVAIQTLPPELWRRVWLQCREHGRFSACIDAVAKGSSLTADPLELKKLLLAADRLYRAEESLEKAKESP